MKMAPQITACKKLLMIHVESMEMLELQLSRGNFQIRLDNSIFLMQKIAPSVESYSTKLNVVSGKSKK